MTAQQVFVIDDDDAYRWALESMLQVHGFVVRAFSSGWQFLDVALPDGPMVVVTDMNMPDMSGVELQRAAAEKFRSVPFLFISGDSSVQEGVLAMKNGAIDFLVKPFSETELVAGIKRALARDADYLAQRDRSSALAARLEHLSPRERQVHRLLVQGRNNAEIVAALGVSVNTAKQYKAEVMRKFGANSLADLISLSRAD